MPDVMRIIDANANRAREALRVLEEAARFLLDDPALTEQCKQSRHDLSTAIAALPDPATHRDTPGDVGTHIALPSEQTRASVGEVVQAAGKRLSEALRAIEEYAKVIDARVAVSVEQLRYRGYEIERQLSVRFPTGRGQQWRICLLLTESLCAHHAWDALAEQAVAAGADCIQLREKSHDDAELLRRARMLRDITRGRAALIINDRPDIALLAEADGVHLGQDDLAVHDVRRIAGRRLLVGVSTHDLSEAGAAVAAGADYCGIGAMFASAIKPDRRPSGPAYLRAFVERFPDQPHLAIGGVTPENVRDLAAVGCRGVAVSSAVLGSPAPASVVRAISKGLSRTEHATASPEISPAAADEKTPV